jgi:hypothetical protein
MSVTRLRPLLAAYLLGIAVITASYAYFGARAHHPWILGEWLINYRGGLIRRGLAGELLLQASRLLHLPLWPLAGAVVFCIYAAFYGCVFRLTRDVRWNAPLILAFASPATLAFSVLDPPSALRKEVLLFLAVAAVSLLVRRDVQSEALRSRRLKHTSIFLAIAAPLLVLAHEPLFSYLPYLFAPVFFAARNVRYAARLSIVPAALAIVAATVAVTHHGDAAQAAEVCRSVGAKLDLTDAYGACSGAIAYLARDLKGALWHTREGIRLYSYGWRYPIPIALALLPAALLMRSRCRLDGPEDLRKTRLLIGFACVAVFASLPLFVVARDWGRWTHIHAVCLMLLGLLLERAPVEAPNLTAECTAEESRPLRTRRIRIVTCAFMAIYTLGWTLPSVGQYPGRFGYVDLLRYLRTRHRNPHAPAEAACERATAWRSLT